MDLLEIRKKAKGLKEDAKAAPLSGEVAVAVPPRRQKKKKPVAAAVEAPPPEKTLPPESAPVKSASMERAPVKMDAPAKADAEEIEEIAEYLAFMLAEEEYAVKVGCVREIIRPQRLTNVPRAPEYILGIISLRGVILPVYDVRRRLGLEEKKISRTTRVLIISDGGSLQGVLVDRVTGVVRLNKIFIEPAPSVIGGVEAEYLDGIGRDGERLLILFNTGRVLNVGQ